MTIQDDKSSMLFHLSEWISDVGTVNKFFFSDLHCRSLLGISSGENEENHNNTPAMNGSDTTKRQPDSNRWNVPKKVVI